MPQLALLYRLLPPLLVLSLVSNLSILVSPLFMMQVLDRVLPSGNQSTLLLLGMVAAGALALQACVDAARDKSLTRTACWIEKHGTAAALAGPNPQSQVDQVGRLSQFLSGPGAVTALSMPWLPLLLGVLALLHPAFALTLLGLLCLSALARWATGVTTGPLEKQAQTLASMAQDTLRKSANYHGRGAGTAGNLRRRFQTALNQKLAVLASFQSATARGAAIGAFLRQATQIIALGLGAYLVTIDALSAGGMIAASLLMGKTHGLTESAVQNWPDIRRALASFQDLHRSDATSARAATSIDSLSGGLRVESLVFPRSAGEPPRLDRVSFTLAPGEFLVIAGGAGSGKTTLLKALAGVAPAPIGAAYLEDSEVRSLSDEDLFRHVGYLPQLAPTLPGTVAENISCFDPAPRDADIVDAAKTAGMHGLISALPQSYESNLETQPYLLSAGQTQRLALARAIFNKPKYLFLDEPNALLDAEGERALFQTLAKLKEQGTTIIVVLHRSGLMALADKVLRLEMGRVADFGTRSEVLARMDTGQRQIELPLLETSLQDLRDWVAAQFSRGNDEAFRQKAQILASEAFSALFLAGPKDIKRKVLVRFEYQSDTACDISLSEPRGSDLQDELERIRHLAQSNPFALNTLTSDSEPLLAALRIANKLRAKCSDDMTSLEAHLDMEASGPSAVMRKRA
jgi:ABC-type protease/lipase transport system fused ATPase/permease subunit